MQTKKDFQEMFGIVDSHKYDCFTKIILSFYPDFTENHNFFLMVHSFFVKNYIKMGYYRKGHYKKDGTWVSGHYVSAFGGKRKSKSPQGCAVIIFGGIISMLLYLLS